MNLKIIEGNIFTSDCQTIVNTVNCEGVMGAGIALECRLRYPEMYHRYVKLCKEEKISIGMLWLYKAKDRWVLNFPTKIQWRYPSKTEYLHAGLKKFVATYKDKGIESIALPLLGADKGGIPKDQSLSIIESYLGDIDIVVEVYKYIPHAEDDLYGKTKYWLLSQDIEYLSNSTNLRKDLLVKVMKAMQSDEIHQLNQLRNIDGIGIRTLEKIFIAARDSIDGNSDTVKQHKLI